MSYLFSRVLISLATAFSGKAMHASTGMFSAPFMYSLFLFTKIYHSSHASQRLVTTMCPQAHTSCSPWT
jgi:hypothetical protein